MLRPTRLDVWITYRTRSGYKSMLHAITKVVDDAGPEVNLVLSAETSEGERGGAVALLFIAQLVRARGEYPESPSVLGAKVKGAERESASLKSALAQFREAADVSAGLGDLKDFRDGLFIGIRCRENQGDDVPAAGARAVLFATPFPDVDKLLSGVPPDKVKSTLEAAFSEFQRSVSSKRIRVNRFILDVGRVKNFPVSQDRIPKLTRVHRASERVWQDFYDGNEGDARLHQEVIERFGFGVDGSRLPLNDFADAILDGARNIEWNVAFGALRTSALTPVQTVSGLL